MSINGLDRCDCSVMRQVQRTCNRNVKEMLIFAFKWKVLFPCHESTEQNNLFFPLKLIRQLPRNFVPVRFLEPFAVTIREKMRREGVSFAPRGMALSVKRNVPCPFRYFYITIRGASESELICYSENVIQCTCTGSCYTSNRVRLATLQLDQN